jgi:hypothetical protein
MTLTGDVSTGWSKVVDVWHAPTNTWTKSTLSVPRGYGAGMGYGTRAYFAEGQTGSTDPVSSIEILDLTTMTWTVRELSMARYALAAAIVGSSDNEVKIASGGGVPSPWSDTYSSNVDFIDVTTLVVTNVTSLSIERAFLSATSLIGYGLFIGGITIS